jgi:ATP/maltotriose-dependent transcriptional regulator MalT
MFETAIETLDKDDPGSQCALVLLLSETGWLAIRLGRFEQAEDMLNQCQTIYQQQRMKPLAGVGTDPLLGLGTLASIRGDYEKALLLSEQARQTAATQNHPWNEYTANYQLASSSYALGAYDQAMSYALAAHALTKQTQDHWFQAYCLIEMGKAAQALGDLTGARRHFETSYSLREALADPEGMAVAMNHLGEVAWRQGDFAEAERFFTESATIYRKIDDRGGLAVAYHGLGRTAVAREAYDEARQQFHHALQIGGDIQFVTFQLAVLADVGDFLLRTGRIQHGLSLLQFVKANPAASQAVKKMAEQQLMHYKTVVSPTIYNAARPPADIQAATRIALAELLTPATVADIESPPSALPPAAELVEPLTEREQEVLTLVAQGYTNKQIADTLSVVVGTVKAHNNRLFGKLAVSNRAQAIARARELGIIS